MAKIILDIRHYASDIENVSGNSLPSNCSRYFNFPKELHFWGDRIARRLGNFGLSIGTFDHVYINYTSVLSENKLVISNRTLEAWLQYIDYGISHNCLNKLSQSELENFIISSTLKSLAILCSTDHDKRNILNSVKEEIAMLGTELEIEAKRKENKSYSIVISYKINPNGKGSYGLVSYKNRKDGKSFKQKFIDLKSYSDIYSLIGNIVIKNEKIVLTPRKSFKASIYTKSYSIPLEIDIQKALQSQMETQ